MGLPRVLRVGLRYRVGVTAGPEEGGIPGYSRFMRYEYKGTLMEAKFRAKELAAVHGQCTLEAWSVLGGWQIEDVVLIESK